MDSISIKQDLPAASTGFPNYFVTIRNVCTISNIHLSCGWYSSAFWVNPAIFRRLAYNDCIVNDAKLLDPGDSVSFQYPADTFYPLAVSSLSCSS